MVEQEVVQRGSSFAAEWNESVQAAESLMLDFSWPSVSVLGALVSGRKAADAVIADLGGASSMPGELHLAQGGQSG